MKELRHQRVGEVAFPSAMIVATLFVFGGLVQSVKAAPTSESSPNAALVYWQAFALMPAESDEENTIFANDGGVDFKKHKYAIKGIVKASSDSLRLLRAADGMDRCDWGLVDAGFSTLLPHISKARRLVRLALLHARYHADSRDLKEAVTDVIAAKRLARHVGRKYLIEMLVQIALENQTNELIREITPRLNAASAERLYLEIVKLPKATTFSDAIRGEASQVAALIENAMSKGELAKTVALFDSAGGPKDVIELLKGGPEAIRAMTKQTLAHYEKLAVAGELPLDKGKAAIKALDEEVAKSKNPISRVFMPAASRAYERWHEAKVDDEKTLKLLDEQRKK